ncbi:CHAP domain-containing protein [Aeromicrobium senzhongii]|uniref:CHAP domain-containing protein n=1 Tax=Aeromicrobium senzhongii TaxID=2663859 RepID=A0ABX6SY39_9ACTN|nr:GDSL-type esterase/lipase family protein [Aeromicrobium senzhongii]MTB88561.1 CHAP domain-containing protein [Aeromicrobium senzhongii]QNL94125.1 CHAP domain-containing protein [Aeromicrobium senzhongii]
MSRRVMTWAATFAVAASLMMAPGVASATADETDPSTGDGAAPVVTPTSPATTAPPVPTPIDGGTGGGGGDVIVPDPTAPGPSAPRVLVFGDSISAPGRYRATAGSNRIKAWWAWVAEGAGMNPREVMVSAEAGSGIVPRGGGSGGRVCTGSTFGDRLGKVSLTRPDVIMVEVGRNDIWDCAGTRRVAVDPLKRQRLATSYFARLAQEADRNGVARSKVYVLTAWGSLQSNQHPAVASLYESLARSHGFSWIPLAALPKAQTTDGVHPNAHGAQTLGTGTLKASDVAVAIASRGKRSGAVATAQGRVRCQSLRTCKAAGVRTFTYAKAPKRVWGVAGPSPRHFVAHALTTSGRPAPVLQAGSAKAWRSEAVRSRSAVQTAHPKPGDIAWWPTAPPGVAPSAQGHVGLVQRVSADNTVVDVSEVTSTGRFRSVRYSGASRPRGFLRFKPTDGSPRGVVTSVKANRRAVVVSGRAVDTDAERRGTRIRVTVTQGRRTWTRTAKATRFGFSHRIATPGLRRGTATVKVKALNAPHSRGKNRALLTRRATIA